MSFKKIAECLEKEIVSPSPIFDDFDEKLCLQALYCRKKVIALGCLVNSAVMVLK